MLHQPREWEGLKFESVEYRGRTNRSGVQLARSVLVHHRTGGRAFGVRVNGYAWKFTTHAGRFDYYPAGHYDTLNSGPDPLRAVKVEIPVGFENSVLEEGRWEGELSPRFQFQDRRLEGLVHSLVHAADSAMAPPDAILLSVALVDRLYETAGPGNGERSATFTHTVRRLIEEYIDQYLGSSIDVDKVAFLTGLARTQFGKVFRETFGMPLHKYVIARKILVATQRLLDDVRVTELSHELGFSSHAHFSTVFRHHVGITPSQFRKDSALAGKAAVRQ